jgi:hypothetical protein
MLDDDSGSCGSRKRSYDDGECDTDCVDTWSESSSVESMSPSYSSGRTSAAADAFSEMALLSYNRSPDELITTTTTTTTHHQPKRARSASFDAILDDCLPDGGRRSRLSADEARASKGESSSYVFPHISVNSTRTPSPVTMMEPPPSHSKFAYARGSLLESSERPDFLKPLSAAERKKLRLAGRGAAIIRVNSELTCA